MKYRLNPERILFTQLGEEGVAFDVITNNYVSFNETICKILHEIEEGHDSDTIVEHLRAEYDISEEDCRNEVQAALGKLIEREYITG